MVSRINVIGNKRERYQHGVQAFKVIGLWPKLICWPKGKRKRDGCTLSIWKELGFVGCKRKKKHTKQKKTTARTGESRSRERRESSHTHKSINGL